VGLFAPDEVWYGGDYELAVVLASRDDLVPALERLWAHPRIDGPYASNAVEPEAQDVVPPAVEYENLWPVTPRFGVATLWDGRRIACLVFLMVDPEPVLKFGIPQGAVDLLYGQGASDSNAWLLPATSWLRDVCLWVQEAVHVRSWAIAEEIADDIALGDLPRD
jgi:hypothetical protein